MELIVGIHLDRDQEPPGPPVPGDTVGSGQDQPALHHVRRSTRAEHNLPDTHGSCAFESGQGRMLVNGLVAGKAFIGSEADGQDDANSPSEGVLERDDCVPLRLVLGSPASDHGDAGVQPARRHLGLQVLE